MYFQAIASHTAWNRNNNNGTCTCPTCLAASPAGPSLSSVTPAAATSASSTPASLAFTSTTLVPASGAQAASFPATSSTSSTLAVVESFPGLTPTSKPVDDPNARPKVLSIPKTKGKVAASSNTISSQLDSAALILRAHEQTRSANSQASPKTVSHKAWDVRDISSGGKGTHPGGKLPTYCEPRLTEDPNSLDDGVRFWNPTTEKLMTFHYDIKRLGLLRDEDPNLCSGVFGGGIDCLNLTNPDKCAFHHDVAPDFFKTVIENRNAKTEVHRMVKCHNERRPQSGAASLSVPDVTSALGPSQSTAPSIVVPVSQAPAHVKNKIMDQIRT